jgi:PAS domain S-box-containing protein
MQPLAPPETRDTGTTLLQSAIASVSLLLCGALVVWLGWMVLHEIDAFSTANSDNLQWNLSQADVEVLQFRLAVAEARDRPDALTEVRLRFDIFYSRMTTLQNGRLFRLLQTVPDFAAPQQRVRAFLDRSIPLIDGPDEALYSKLPELAEGAAAAGADVRALSLAGLSTFAELSDSRRERVSGLLGYMAGALVTLFLGLSLLALTMFRLFRVARRRADAIEIAGTRMRTIVETSPNAIVVTDEDGLIRGFNTAAERMLGYSRDDVFGKPARQLFAPPERPDERTTSLFAFADERRRPTPEERRFEISLRDRDGRLFPAEFSIDRAGTDDPLYVAYIRDISRWKEVEEQLTEARDRALAGDRSKSEFLAVMSHEMRTPLNGLLGTLQLLCDEELPERQRAMLDRMEASGRLLLELVNDVLDLAKFEAGKMTAERAPFSLTALIGGVVETVRPIADRYRNALSWRWVGPEGDWVEGDARRLRQVLLNLVGNALKFTRDGTVEIEAEYLDDACNELELRVIDSGIGIREEDLAQIFRDFETLDSSYAREAGGTGLGLGIAQRFARLMGGSIGAESEPGEGSLFWVRLPLPQTARGATEDAPVSVGAEQPQRPLDLLVIEDNEINRFILCRFLERDGHRVELTLDGQAGVDAAMCRRFDAIFMDISMPVMDGTTAARQIRAGGGASAKTPIIALTAHAFAEERKSFEAAGMNAFLTKPVDRGQIRETLSGLIAVEFPCAPHDRSNEEETGRNVALVDLERPRELIEALPEDAARALLARFLDETERDLEWLAEADVRDPEIAAVAHRCAGSCGTFGAEALRRELVQIEAVIKAGDIAESKSLQALGGLWQRTRFVLEGLFDQS